jgi:tRNA (guanosine-2'-O-)-methyltransferase
MRSVAEECLRADRETKTKLLDYLETMITEQRKEKFGEILRNRTRFITIVLEDIFQPHNASAVLRTCDCFGIQDVHIIENRNRYEVNPDVALGSSKWLTLHKYNKAENNTAECLSRLKEEGYRIIATTPHKDDFTPQTLPIGSKFALVFGTELEGLTETAISMADGFVRIPMFGFTESEHQCIRRDIALCPDRTGPGTGYRLADGRRGNPGCAACVGPEQHQAVRHYRFRIPCKTKAWIKKSFIFFYLCKTEN